MIETDDREWAGYLDTLGRYYRLRRWFAENRQHDVEDILLDQYGRVVPEGEDIAAAMAEVTRWRKQRPRHLSDKTSDARPQNGAREPRYRLGDSYIVI